MAFIIFGVLMISFFSRSNFFKNLLRSYIPSGSGPSKKERKNHWFKSVFIAKLKKSEIEVHISGGDPGYEETAKFISESALCIINDRDKLLNDRGVLTPMECMGNLLITRLENSGLQIIIKD